MSHIFQNPVENILKVKTKKYPNISEWYMCGCVYKWWIKTGNKANFEEVEQSRDVYEQGQIQT